MLKGKNRYIKNKEIFQMTDKERRLRIQSVMAVVSFSVGSIIACICLFAIEPLGEIATSAISVTSEFLILAGALLGISASFDTKMQKFKADIEKEMGKPADAEV